MRIPVAPLVGAWIEISFSTASKLGSKSLLSWERGLKYKIRANIIVCPLVAPLVGAWIEIPKKICNYKRV